MSRIAITGISAITPIGDGLEAFSAGLRDGVDGVDEIRGFDASRHRVQRAAEVDWQPPAGSSYSRATELALEVSAQALASAGLDERFRDESRGTVLLASNQGGMAADCPEYRRTTHPYRSGGVSRDLGIRMLDGAPAATLDLLMARCPGAHLGINLTTACSAGLHALGIAYETLLARDTDFALVTGVEVLTEPALAGFAVLRALTPGEGPRPFSEDRDGTLLGEGAAALVVEPLAKARARGAPVLAEICGYGSSTDAYHMTRPLTEGPEQAMRQALAGVGADAVDWIKAHGTATPANDLAETTAIHKVFGDHARRLPVTSMKSQIGHSLGASGVVEAVGTILAMRGGFVPPTLRLDRRDPALDLDVVHGGARDFPSRYVLLNAFGFGGNNASITLAAANGC